jgi:thiol-disulfide isomerase/thioredoxin
MYRNKPFQLTLLIVWGMVGVASPVSVIGFSQNEARDSGSKDPSARRELPEPRATELISAKEFRRLLAKEQGNVLVVNFWATWCIPCIREFPDLSKLQEKHSERGLKVIAVSMDDPELLDTKVKRFIQEHRPGFVTYLQTEADPDTFASVVDPGWSGVVPTTYVIDRTGKVRKSMVGRRSYEEFEAAITPLL